MSVLILGFKDGTHGTLRCKKHGLADVQSGNIHSRCETIVLVATNIC